MKTLTLSAYWRPRGAAPGHYQESFPVRLTTWRYERSPWVPENIQRNANCHGLRSSCHRLNLLNHDSATSEFKNSAGSIGYDLVTHGGIALSPFVPHSGQLGVLCLHIVIDAHIRLECMRAV